MNSIKFNVIYKVRIFMSLIMDTRYSKRVLEIFLHVLPNRNNRNKYEKIIHKKKTSQSIVQKDCISLIV